MPRMRWQPGLRPGPRWGSSRRSPRSPSRLGSETPPPKNPTPLAFQRSALAARRHVSSVYPPQIFASTPLIGSIVGLISFSRGCLPNDEGPGPQIFFPRTATDFQTRTPTLKATMHSVTDRWTDGQQDDANCRSYCVAVRSANSRK